MRTGLAVTIVIALLGAAAGVAAQQADPPSTAEELLARMVSQEVEPGVFRITHDGVRELRPGHIEHLVAGRDGSVWTFGMDGFRRLGSEQPETIGAGAALPPHDDFGVDPDGTLWVDGTHWGHGEWEGLGSFDGQSWTRHRPDELPAGHRPWGLHVAADGSMWVLLAAPGEWQSQSARLARFDGRGWEVADFVPRALPELFAGDSASVWAVGDSALPTLHHFDAGRWQPQDTPAGFPGQWLLVVGPGDTLWTLLWPGAMADFGTPPTAIALHDGDEWQQWDESSFPMQGHASLLSALQPMDAGPDGSIWSQVLWGSWVSPWSPEWSEPECDGVARFDRGMVSRYLEGLCVGALDAASDGSVWVLAGPDEPNRDLYVITPGAAAATK